MGWSSGNDIVEPQVLLLVKRVDNDELHEAVAQDLLATLISNCQNADWDAEDEVLESFAHVPWVVRAFATRGVRLTEYGKKPPRTQVKNVVRSALDAVAEESGGDLYEIFWRDKTVTAITDAMAALFDLEEEIDA
jgi:hypothetical protein